jgi:polysaccharide export outer membrane protein
VIALAAGVAGCAGGRAPAPRADGGTGQVASVAAARDRERMTGLAAARARQPASGGYRIGPDDLLDVRIPDLLDTPAVEPARGDGGLAAVAGAPTFAQGVRVSGNGDVTLPYLGQLRADGLTPAELERDVAARLVERGILRAPQVTVSVVEYRSRVVAVVGAVERPGVFPLTRPGATISDLVWAAGGPSKDAGRVVQFTPADDGAGEGRAPMRLDLVELLDGAGNGRPAAALPVRPGDVISVAPAGSVTVQGWVEKPGAYPVTRGLSLTGAVAAAGGPLFPADRHRATLRRAVGGEEQRVVADLDAIASGETRDVPVTDGDVVDVPASNARLVPWGVWRAVSDVFRLGGSIFLF